MSQFGGAVGGGGGCIGVADGLRMNLGDVGGGNKRSPVMSGRGGALWVVEGLVRGIVAGSLELPESSGKTSHTVSHSFLMSFSIRLSFWSA